MSIPQTPSPLAAIIASGTYDMNWFSGSTPEAKVQAAINAAFADGAPRVLVHGPYNANLVAFNNSVLMVIEGGNWDVRDLRAYGAYGDGVTDDTAAIRAWAGAAGYSYANKGTYVISPLTSFNMLANTTLEMSPDAVLFLQAACQIPADSYLFVATLGADNVSFLNVNVNGNRLNQTRRIRGFVGFKANNPKIDGCHFFNFGGSAAVITNCPGTIFTRNLIELCGRKWIGASGIQGEQGFSILCDVATTDPFYSPGAIIAFNRVRFNGWDGINFSSPYTKCVDNISHNNGLEFLTVGASGIYCTSGATMGPHGSLIEGNTVYANTGNGIDTGPNTIPILGQEVVHNQCYNNMEAGIVRADVQYDRTEDNKCWNNFQPSTKDENGNVVTITQQTIEKGGITLTSRNPGGAVDTSTLRRNFCYDDQGGKTQVYGIQMGSNSGGPGSPSHLTNLILEDNNLVGNLTAAVGSAESGKVAPWVDAGTYVSMRRNQGYVTTITTGAVIPNVAEFITVTYAGATNLTGISSGRVEDRLTLLFTNGNATLINSATLILRGGVNVTPANGNTITLLCDTTSGGGTWREISRNF